jgi:hypothetical protein
MKIMFLLFFCLNVFYFSEKKDVAANSLYISSDILCI